MAAVALALVIVFGLIRGDDFDDLFVIGIASRSLRSRPGCPRSSRPCSRSGRRRSRRRGDREAAPVGGDARRDVGDLLRQDGHADAQPDDRPPAADRRAAATRSRTGVRDRGEDPSCRRRDGHPSSRSSRWPSPTTPPCVTARSSATATRRRSSCSRRRRSRRRRDAPPSARRRGAVRLRPQVHGDLPRDGGRRPEGDRCFVKGAPDVLLARSSRAGTWTDHPSDRRRYRDRVLAENDRLAAEGLRVLAVAARHRPFDFDAGGDLLAQVRT